MGLINLKLIITVVILLGIILITLSMHPAMTNFIDRIFDRFTGFAPERDADRNVTFILSSDEYIDLYFTNQNINIIVDSDNFTAELGSGIIESDKNVTIIGTAIFGHVKGNEKRIFFEGDFSKIEVEGTAINMNAGNIRVNITFNTLSIENLELDKLDMREASGTIIYDDAITTIGYKTVNISYPLARFDFASQLHVDGIGEKLVAENIVIG